MKPKLNIPALFLALLVVVATNGVFVFEHICNTSQSRNFSLFSKPTCGMEKPLPVCCAKIGLKKQSGCCHHKQFFSKLSIEGFTANTVQVKPCERSLNNFSYLNDFTHANRIISADYISGLPPPDNLYKIKALLQPTPDELQVFRC